MQNQDAFLKNMTNNVASEIADGLKNVITEALEQHLNQSIRQALAESEFYRRLSDDMLSGLQKIYKEIHQASQDSNPNQTSQDSNPSQDPIESKSFIDKGEANQLFTETSKQLDEIMNTTLEATENIMGTTETLLDSQQEVKSILKQLSTGKNAAQNIERLTTINEGNSHSCTAIMEALSFQDLTGQRMKKVVAALGQIESIVFELYVSSGLMMKTSQKNKEKDFEELSVESKKKAQDVKQTTKSKLSGPSSNAASQSDVDDLLANLGL